MWGTGRWLRIYSALLLKHYMGFLAPLFHEGENILLKCNFTRNYFTYSLNEVSRRPCCAVAFRRTAWSEHGIGAAWQV